MPFKLSTYDAITIRENPTTQVQIERTDWPGNRFLLWLPESVGDLWNQWTPDIAHQDFKQTSEGGLVWRFDRQPEMSIEASLIPKGDEAILLEVCITNRGDADLEHATCQNCFHLSQSPDFVCDDCSRIVLRTDGQWRSIGELNPTSQLPMYYRPRFREEDRVDSWRGHYQKDDQSARADHPMMMCVSRDGQRVVATASENYQCVFHNTGRPYLLCIHSQQTPVERLAPGEAAWFRQWLFFVDGGVDETVEVYNRYCEAD